MAAWKKETLYIRSRLPELDKLMIAAKLQQFIGPWMPQMVFQQDIHQQSGSQGR